MNSIPNNLTSLHKGEEHIRTLTIDEIVKNEDLSDHLCLVENAMNILDVLRQVGGETEDEKTVTLLGLRIFNDFASSWKLASTGYFQSAAMQLRDIIEATNLVNAFYNDRSLIEKWRLADGKTRKQKYSPFQIRLLLDKHQGWSKSRRAEIYEMFCNLANHPTTEGFEMLRPDGKLAHNGPYFNPKIFRAVIEEAGKLAALTGIAFVMWLDNTDERAKPAIRRYMLNAAEYYGKYIGEPYSPEKLAEIDQLFSA